MNAGIQLSLTQARKLHLHAQGLLKRPAREASKQNVLQCIRQMGALQIDTIHVVARSPYLVLWSRLGHYQPQWLDELLAERQLFEYWSHEACFLPIEQFAWYRHHMLSPQHLGWKFNQKWLREQADNVSHVLSSIRAQGASGSRDFQSDQARKSGWWEWKPEKRSLEVLFTSGQLMVARRDKFQRIYDLTERVHPDWRDESNPCTPHQAEREMVLTAIRALGICKSAWVRDYFRQRPLAASNTLEQLAEQGLLLQAHIKGQPDTYTIHPDHAALALELQNSEAQIRGCRILSPFDPVVWDRQRLKEFFDFDYRLECYTPEPKRQYGYFCLPVLRNGKFIARIDAKAHRADRVMEIKAFHAEPGFAWSERLRADLLQVFTEFSAWHDCDALRITASPALTKAQLRSLQFSKGSS